MRDEPIDLITIAREYGAGGSELARVLGDRLGWPVLDRDLAARAAARLGIDLESVETLDEQAPTLLARLASAMVIYPPEAPLLVDTGEMLSPDAVARAVREEITDAARTPPLIVVGHGGQCLFGGRPGALHLRLVAPIGERTARICARDRCDQRSAAAAVRRMDDDRHAYLRRYHDAEWRDPLLYDLEINTGRMSVDEAAALVVNLIEARSRAPIPGAGTR